MDQEIEIENTRNDYEVAISIGQMPQSLPFSSPERCIYRVPITLRVIKLKEYTPQLVSIGPFHHGEEHLQAMEEHKLRYLQSFLNRIGLNLEDCVEVVRRWEESARRCYAETIKLSSDKFVKMILVDGSFIVELLLRYYFKDLRDGNDPIFTNLSMVTILPYNTMLLENQLPFFVLESLFALIPNSKLEGSPSFLDLTSKFLGTLLRINGLPNTFPHSKIEHFVDFMHSCFLSSIPDFEDFEHFGHYNAEYDHPPTVTQLHEAGIKFKKRAGSSLFDIKFSNGILQIPPLVISDPTDSLFRNLLAFEHCHRTRRSIISYMFLFDGFIKTTKDVDLLIGAGIIELKRGNSEDAAAIFKNVLSASYYYVLCRDLLTFCRKRRRRLKATLRRDYFNAPWSIISFIVTVVLVTILTFMQTVFCHILYK